MTTTRIPLEKFKAMVSAGGKDAVDGLALLKALPSEIVAGDDRVITVKASTKAADRDKDTIDPAGWQLGNFAKNGPILWAHDSRALPVGKSRKTWIENDALMAEIEFPAKGTYPFADTVYDLCKGGFLNAVSVGFLPVEWKMNAERGDFAMDFLKQELLEISIVPIPSNPEALVEARSANGIDIEPLTQWAESTLENVRGKGFWVPAGKRPAFTATAPTTKQGRVLSAANETTLKGAVEAIDTATDKIEAVLAQVAVEEGAAPAEAKCAKCESQKKGDEQCPTCAGTGKVDGADCADCGGTGTMKGEEGEPCGDCEGSGVCKGCSGTGKKPKAAPEDESGKSISELLSEFGAILEGKRNSEVQTFTLDLERVSSTIARRIDDSLIGPLLGRVPNNQ